MSIGRGGIRCVDILLRAILIAESLFSLEMGLHYLLLQNNNRLECHPREVWADVCLEALVFRLSWKDGNIRSSLQVNTSTSFENVVSKPVGMKVDLRMTFQWMMKSMFLDPSFSFRFH
jgi:hypothetical protein